MFEKLREIFQSYDPRNFPNSAIKKMVLMAEKHGWVWTDFQPVAKMVSFKKFWGDNEVQRINIHYLTMLVASSIEHPKKGRTQLFRREITMVELERIFQNPRVHTDKGTYVKP